MKWLCKIGLHSWEHLGLAGLSLDCSVKRCRRCGIGHLDICYGQAYVRYTKEEVDMFWRAIREVGEEAKEETK